MFTLITDPAEQKYKTPIVVQMRDESGQKKKVTFSAWFRRLTQTEMDDLNDRLIASRKAAMEGEDADQSKKIKDAEIVHEVMVGWEGVKDENGMDVPFNAENLDKLMDVNPVRPTLAKAFFDTINDSGAKN